MKKIRYTAAVGIVIALCALNAWQYNQRQNAFEETLRWSAAAYLVGQQSTLKCADSHDEESLHACMGQSFRDFVQGLNSNDFRVAYEGMQAEPTTPEPAAPATAKPSAPVADPALLKASL